MAVCCDGLRAAGGQGGTVSRVEVCNGVRTIVLEAEDADVCQLCGAVAETRPYGPGGKHVCFKCGMKDEAGALRRFKLVMFGEGEA